MIFSSLLGLSRWLTLRPSVLAPAYLRFRVSPSVAHYPYAIRRSRNSQGIPSSLSFLSMRTALSTPADPRRSHLLRPLCIGFWFSDTIAICFISFTELYQASQCADTLAVCMILCLRFSYVIAFTPARLDMGGWFCLTQQGLAPCKKRQAS